ncbi:hypothetical protein Acr_12g0004950 [Actinidia rufa]|uniref:Uncharacterized protein n=1 Tax=Actinidia rufa TaxID=165716 RepID=A0A7J0FGX9_9ERIC|nr:hypothetical protein Acr_12g0004950 [Actinidia rufa]
MPCTVRAQTSRNRENNSPLSGGNYNPSGMFGAVEGAKDIDVEDVFEISAVEVEDGKGKASGSASIAEHDVESAVLGHGNVDR